MKAKISVKSPTTQPNLFSRNQSARFQEAQGVQDLPARNQHFNQQNQPRIGALGNQLPRFQEPQEIQEPPSKNLYRLNPALIAIIWISFSLL